jgi:hypothetical protein
MSEAINFLKVWVYPAKGGEGHSATGKKFVAEREY